MAKKHTYAHSLAKIKWEHGVLEIIPRKLLSCITLAMFAGIFIAAGIKLSGSNVFFMALAFIGGGFAAIGFFSVLFSNSYLLYKVARKRLTVRRKSLFKFSSFDGAYEDQLRIKAYEAGNNYADDLDDPTGVSRSLLLLLIVELDDAVIPYQIPGGGSWSQSKKDADEWRAKLKIEAPTIMPSRLDSPI